MHLVIVVHIFFPEHRAGVETYALQLASRLSQTVRVTVVTTRKVISLATGTIRERSVEGLPVIEVINNLDGEAPETAWSNPTMELALGRVLDDLRPDAVHFQHLMYWSAGALGVAKSRGLRTVLTLHDYFLGCARFGQLIDFEGKACPGPSPDRCAPCVARTPLVQGNQARRWIKRLVKVRKLTGVALDDPLRRLQQWRRKPHAEEGPTEVRVDLPAWKARYEERRTAILDGIAAADLIITPSATLRETVVGWGVPEESIVRIPQGLDPTPFATVKRTPAADGRVRLGFIGTIAPHKGVDVLVRAALEVDPQRVTLDVWGPDRQHAEYGAECRALAGEAPHIRFHGPLSRQDVPSAHERIDVLCVPSLWNECCPLTIQEAFMSGMPAVVSDLGGMSELVEEGIGGLRAVPGDVHDWRRVLARLAEEPGLLEALRASVPRVPTLDEHIGELMTVYRGGS